MRLFFLLSSFFLLKVIQAQHAFSIQGNSADFFNGKKLYLLIEDSYSSNRFEWTDSTTVKDGHFFFYGTTQKLSEWASVYIKNSSNFFYFVIDTSQIIMSIQPVSKKSPTYKNLLSAIKIENSASNRMYRKIDSLGTSYYVRFGKPALTNKNIIELDKQRKAELRAKELEILRENPQVFYSLIQLFKLSASINADIEDMSRTFDALDEKIRTSALGQEFQQKLNTARSTMIGRIVPEFSTKTEKDYVFSTAAMLGKPYLLAFGATWCIPCKKNYPMLKSLYQKYKSKGFEIVAVNLDDDKPAWEKQIKQYSLNWINISELKKWKESDLVNRFNVKAVPFYILVSRDGKITYNSFQLSDFDNKQLEKHISDAVE
jgi:thiol-disulfide isomerase/thioredoxin